MQGFVKDLELLTLFGTLEVRFPRAEDVLSVWEQDTADIILGALDDFEKLRNDARFGRYSFFRLASEDKEYVLTLFDQILCLVAGGAT